MFGNEFRREPWPSNKKVFLLMALIRVSLVGEKQDPWRNAAKSAAFLSVRIMMVIDFSRIGGVTGVEVLGIGISQRPSPEVLRVPSSTFLLFLNAVNFFFVR